MSRIIPLVVCLALVTSFASAQLSGLAGVVSPSSAPMGAPITLTVTAYGAPQNFSTLGFSNVYRVIHQGSPTGPAVWYPFGFTNPTTLNPGQSMSSWWNQIDFVTGLQVPAGDYYFEVLTPGSSSFFHFRIESPTTPLPTLSAQSGAVMGQPLVIDLDNSAPGATYITACAFTTNTGVQLSPTWHLSLDQDALFDLSFPSPNPALFTGLQGTVDANGHGTMAMLIPSAPFLADVGIQFQAAVIQSNGFFELTNTASFKIQ